MGIFVKKSHLTAASGSPFINAATWPHYRSKQSINHIKTQNVSSPRASFAPVLHNLLHARPPSGEFQAYPCGWSISACARDTVE